MKELIVVYVMYRYVLCKNLQIFKLSYNQHSLRHFTCDKKFI